MKDRAFMIEIIKEVCEYRTIIRNWVEIDGHVEIVYQEWCMDSGAWEDKEVTPAFHEKICWPLKNQLI